MTNNFLQIKDLSVSFEKKEDEVLAANKVSFSLEKGQSIGIVGESGSGKSVTALSILQLLPYPKAYHKTGSIKIDGIEVIGANKNTLKYIRGNKASMIFQEPMTSLNPLHTIEKQISETIRLHQKISKKDIKPKVIELLKKVGIKEGESRLKSYPHELSGGQRQRVMIAMALANKPDILIADEPTTALDVTIQKQILELIKNLQKEMNMGLIIISHDLSVIQKMTDYICVMKDGIIVEKGKTKNIIKNPSHEYTKHLISSIPKGIAPKKNNTDKILQVEKLKIWFEIKKSLFQKKTQYIKAVDEVSFDVKKGSTLGIVGESGSGKTTLGMSIARLIKSDGLIKFNNHKISSYNLKKMKELRKNIQIVFQDPYGSLNPKMTIKQIVGEGLKVHFKNLSKAEQTNKIIKTLEEVGIKKTMLNRYPHEFSGGQRQRISIARSLILNPELIILDEPTSALDVSIQAQIITLLKKLQEKYELTYIFISHDLNVIKSISNEIIVMQNGKIIEKDTAQKIFSCPKENYTKKLLSASFTVETN